VTRIGADVGGTFTDIVVTGDDGCMTFTKVLSTPPVYDRAARDPEARARDVLNEKVSA
jgi:N-methylhydantoinase A